MSISPSVPDAGLAIPSRARTAWTVLLFAVLCLWVFPYHALVNNPNENVRVYMTVAVVDDHTFAINRVERDWGYTNDKAIRNDRLYSSKAPGTSYLGIPAYWLMTRITGRHSIPLTPAQVAAHAPPPLDRTVIVHVLRLWSSVLPALLFAWFWHRFLGRFTRSAALRDAAFWSSMAGSLLYAYSLVFASHALNAFCAMGALMALASVRGADRGEGIWAQGNGAGRMFVAGLLGAGATMFEYPAFTFTLFAALLVLAMVTVQRRWMLGPAFALLLASFSAGAFKHRHDVGAALLAAAVVCWAFTWSWRSFGRLAAWSLGSVVPTGLTLLYHQRCFGDPFKPGYSYLENPTFRAETSQGFFGATDFSWEACVRLLFDPSFGLFPGTLFTVAALLGAAVLLAPSRATPSSRWVRVAMVVGAAGLLAFAAKHALPFLRAALDSKGAIVPWNDAGWILPATIAAGLLLAAVVPPSVRRDTGWVVAGLLASAVLLRLIGSMNNWRGGWVVGPRYLSTLVPLFTWLALAGFDAVAGAGPMAARVATITASAMTVHAMVTTGIASAWFPHIPTDYTSPTFELFLPLVQGGFVPHNLGEMFLHQSGWRAMAPYVAAAGTVLVNLLPGDEERAPRSLAHSLAALGITAALLAPLAALVHPETMANVRWVMSVWEPRPITAAPAGVKSDAIRIAQTESPASIRQKARALAELGDGNRAFEAYRTAARAERR